MLHSVQTENKYRQINSVKPRLILYFLYSEIISCRRSPAVLPIGNSIGGQSIL